MHRIANDDAPELAEPNKKIISKTGLNRKNDPTSYWRNLSVQVR